MAVIYFICLSFIVLVSFRLSCGLEIARTAVRWAVSLYSPGKIKLNNKLWTIEVKKFVEINCNRVVVGVLRKKNHKCRPHLRSTTFGVSQAVALVAP